MSNNGKTIRDAMKAAGNTPKRPNPYKHDVIYDSRGQWKFPGQVTKIPSGDITMSGVPYPIFGVDNLGNEQIMLPGGQYSFPGQYVTEYPMMYGGDPSLSNITGHYQKGGPNLPSEEMPLSSTSTVKAAPASEDELFEKYHNLLEASKAEKERVENVRKKAATIAAAKAKSKNPKTRTDLSYIKSGAFYCNTHTGECFQDAGATTPEGKPVPVIPGNLQWDAMAPQLGFEWVDKPLPGDIAREQIYRTTDYQGKPLSPGFYTSHSGVVTQVTDPNDPSKIFIGNAPGGNRFSYVNQPIPEMVHHRSPKDYKMKYQRYIGKVPQYKKELEELRAQLATFPIESIPVKSSYMLPQEETELELRQVGGGSLLTNNPYKAASETSGVYKRPIPSLDTLKAQLVKQAARPWNQWSPEEKEQYIKNPSKNMTPAQAEEWNKRAQEWSSAQAKKEHTEDYIRESTKQALVDNPVWNTAVSFTPAGAIGSLMKGAFQVSPNIYKTIKDPTNLINYANVADDVLSMAHVPESAIGFKSLAKLKKVSVPGTHGGLTIGDIKKAYSTEKKFQGKKEVRNIKMGGWLDEYFKGGSGPMTPPGLKKKVRKQGTSRNVQSSINKLFLRNYDLFGPSGRNIYNPKSKYQSGGGWLDNLP